MRLYTRPNTFAAVEGIVYMVLATWRLRKLREENEQKLKAAEEATKEAVNKAVNERWKRAGNKGGKRSGGGGRLGRGGGRRRGPPGCLLTNLRRRNGNRCHIYDGSSETPRPMAALAILPARWRLWRYSPPDDGSGDTPRPMAARAILPAQWRLWRNFPPDDGSGDTPRPMTALAILPVVAAGSFIVMPVLRVLELEGPH